VSILKHSEFQFGDTLVAYELDDATRAIGLRMLPACKASQAVARRSGVTDGPEYAHLPGWDGPAWAVDPLVHVKWIGLEPPNGFAQGRTMHGSPGARLLAFERQTVERAGDLVTVVTALRHPAGVACEHRLSWRMGDTALRISTVLRNESPQPVSLEMLSSFALGSLTPFAPDDAPDRLLVHRFRSSWSAEGRLDTQSAEQLHLERSWAGHGARCERFGQVGSFPTNGFFPCVAVEDRAAGVLWGAQLAWAGSWQMEVYRRDDCLVLAGGLADREFGHWVKTLEPGASLTAPKAILATVAGDVDAVCHRLTSAQAADAGAGPAVEADLPIIFNEWCTSWGRPSHANLVAIADRLRGTPARYLVIDAGWYAPLEGNWSSAQGDWIPNPALYPDGLKAAADAIRARGLIPGLWFEMEVTGPSAAAFGMTGHLLRRDGLTLTVGDRRFWDMNDPFVVDYLSERVIGLLRETGMGYLKVDYNETLGIGVDGAESLGEGLRRQIEGSLGFFDRIRRELPDLVIENCSSGGHRLEPSMMARCSMGSFSDAHETREIPIIAANLHRLILPRQSQIWAVLRKSDDAGRLAYLLTSTFLGRMCLSGDVADLDERQWAAALEAQELYQRVAPIIKHGWSRRHGPAVSSYRHPRGWQAVARVADGGRQALVVTHSFGADVPPAVEVPLPAGEWRIAGQFHANQSAARVAGDWLTVPLDGAYASSAVHLTQPT
jgi:alpha-galactosidase